MMDPNETLAQIRQTLAKPQLTLGEVDEFVELVQSLDDWLTRGGFLPDSWKNRQHLGPAI